MQAEEGNSERRRPRVIITSQVKSHQMTVDLLLVDRRSTRLRIRPNRVLDTATSNHYIVFERPRYYHKLVLPYSLAFLPGGGLHLEFRTAA